MLMQVEYQFLATMITETSRAYKLHLISSREEIWIPKSWISTMTETMERFAGYKAYSLQLKSWAKKEFDKKTKNVETKKVRVDRTPSIKEVLESEVEMSKPKEERVIQVDDKDEVEKICINCFTKFSDDSSSFCSSKCRIEYTKSY